MSELKELERQRKAISERIGEIQQAEDEKKSAQFVGRYFRYRNCYSCPEKASDYWWLYFKVTGYEGRRLTGYSFQRDKYGKSEFDPNAGAYHFLEGYEEIDAAQFVRARAKFLAALNVEAML
jgi:hypothetical protein